MSEEISADGAKISQTACKAAGDKTGGVLGDTWDMAKEAFSEGSDKYDIVVKEDKLSLKDLAQKMKFMVLFNN